MDAPPNAHEDAGATDHIHEIFYFARKLAAEETPLFVREADGYLRRNA